jgi:trimethylamine---corrinoid protein Co-methyltransferase
MNNRLMNDLNYVTPHYNYISTNQCEKINWAALDILERIGVLIYSEEALALLKSAGADVDENLVRIPSGMVEKAMITVPKRLSLYNRHGHLAMPVEGHRVFYGAGSDCLNILDHRSGERRKPILQDVKEGVTLCDALPEIDYAISMVLPTDVDKTVADRYQMEILLNNTTKPIIYVSYDFEGFVEAVKMAEVVAGGEEQLRRKPTILGYINVTTGIRHNKEALDKLLFLSGKGLPAIYAPDVYSGVTGPITIPGTVALTLAGVLTGIVISQLNREGTPIVMPGWGGTPLDLRTMIAPYSHPDARSLMIAMSHYYQLPTFSIGGSSESKLVDQQAAAEAALTLTTETLAGGNIMHDVGYLESGLTYSFAQLIICTEIIRWLKYYTKEIKVDDESLALDLIQAVAHKEQYLQLDDTYNKFRHYYYPEVFEREIYDNWAAHGSKSMAERASEKVDQILQEHQPEPLPTDIQKQLKEILADAVRKV